MITSLQLKVLFWLAITAWALLLFIEGQPVTTSLVKPSSMVLSGLIAAVTIFEKWLWRWKLLYPWFVRVPNLIGTYQGEIHSHGVDASTGMQRGVIPAFLVIHQTLSCLHIRAYTAESESSSVLSSFTEAPDGRCELLYTYRNEPKLGIRPHNSIHYGGARLAITQVAKHLEGCYWTDRQTLGEMKFTRISREISHSFQEGQTLASRQAA